MSASFLIQELAKGLRVHEVSVDAHSNTKRRINVKRLRLGSIIPISVSDPAGSGPQAGGTTYAADDVPMVG